MATRLKQIPLTPTKEHERNARRVAVFVNDPTAPRLVRNALLSALVEAAEVTESRIFYAPENGGEIQVSPADLAWLFCIAEARDLDFQRGGVVDSKGEFIQKRK
ncbi:MAG: hypothetical protein QOG71_2338 [Pyrinomonadaceae bacterium]|nr:hypothetical protein [Pyrinomonadaceae bacterium]